MHTQWHILYSLKQTETFTLRATAAEALITFVWDVRAPNVVLQQQALCLLIIHHIKFARSQKCRTIWMGISLSRTHTNTTNAYQIIRLNSILSLSLSLYPRFRVSLCNRDGSLNTDCCLLIISNWWWLDFRLEMRNMFATVCYELNNEQKEKKHHFDWKRRCANMKKKKQNERAE